MARIKAGVRLPADTDSFEWLLLYSEALRGQHGDIWRGWAEGHTRSGRTDGTSWADWRDEVLAKGLT